MEIAEPDGTVLGSVELSPRDGLDGAVLQTARTIKFSSRGTAQTASVLIGHADNANIAYRVLTNDGGGIRIEKEKS